MDSSLRAGEAQIPAIPMSFAEAPAGDGPSDTPPWPQQAPAEAEHLIAAVRQHVDFAFQPIVSLQSGVCYGYEALLRGYGRLGLPTIAALFDQAWRLGILHTIDLVLRHKAMAAFTRLPWHRDVRLFFNLDNRVFSSPDYRPNQTRALLDDFDLPSSTFCFELSELHDLGNERVVQGILARYRAQSLLLAIDDFGIGYSGLSLLYSQQPDIVKIDRMFVSDIHRDRRKRVLVASIVNLARVLGITVVAEGIETEAEFLECRRIGCDLGQGYFIAHPNTDLSALKPHYHRAIDGVTERRSGGRDDHCLILEELSPVSAVRIGDQMAEVFEMFRRNPHCSYFPVVDDDRRPIGIVHEEALKGFIYAEYGRDLLRNRSLGRSLRDFVSPCPVADVHSDVEEILSVYAVDENPAGVLMVDTFAYVGMLSARSLLRVIHEKTIARASDENPLTKLPGNLSIIDFLAGALENSDDPYLFAYFDLDNFKPYNDVYGFRQGDRVIQLFAKLLSQRFSPIGAFIGHIGGDDFFVGVPRQDLETVVSRTAAVLAAFQRDVESFYDPEARAAGGIVGKDRWDHTRTFALMTASAGLLACQPGSRSITVDAVTGHLSALKKQAKGSAGHIAMEACACAVVATVGQ